MALELVTQEKMDLSSVKQDASMLGHRNFVELFEDENVAEQRKHNTVKQINALILEDIQRHASLAAEDKEKYIAYLMRLSEKEWIGEKASYTKEADQYQRRISELDILLKRLYEDNVFGRISDERFASLSADYEAESRKLKDRYQ